MRILILFVGLIFSSFSYADQLAYISREDAVRAVELIKESKNLYSFCGCCPIEEPYKLNIVNVYYQHTGYEDYYEVIIVLHNSDGSEVLIPIDLAYLWKKGLFKAKTIGQLLGLDHDPCVNLSKWKKHQNDHEDI